MLFEALRSLNAANPGTARHERLYTRKLQAYSIAEVAIYIAHPNLITAEQEIEMCILDKSPPVSRLCKSVSESKAGLAVEQKFLTVHFLRLSLQVSI